MDNSTLEEIRKQKEEAEKKAAELKKQMLALQQKEAAEKERLEKQKADQEKARKQAIQNSDKLGPTKKDLLDLVEADNKSRNSVAGLLKVGSIVLFILVLIGAIALSQKEEVIRVDAGSIYDEPEVRTEKSFDGSTFVTYMLSGAVASVLLFAFGELIQIEDSKYNVLLRINEKIK